MKTCRLLSFALPALLAASACADTIELKDGTKLDGTVLSKDGDNYVVSVQVTKGIKEERHIPRASVARIVAEDKSESAFTEVAALYPVPDLATAAEYETRVTKAEAFLKTYKDSKHKPEVVQILDKLGKEGDAISAGGVKFEGKLITAEERKPQAYTVDSKIALGKVKRLAESDHATAALRAWSDFEVKFQGSAAYRENLPYAIRLMQSQMAIVSQMAADQPALVKRRDDGLRTMADAQRGASRAAIEEDMAAYKTLSDKEKAQQVKWPTLNPYVKEPIEETKRSLDAEIRRMQNMSLANLPHTDEAYAKAWADIHKDGATAQEIKATIGEASNSSLPKEYQELLTASSPVPLDSK